MQLVERAAPLRVIVVVMAMMVVFVSGCIQEKDNAIVIDFEKGVQEAKNLTETVKETAATKAKEVPRNVTIKLPDIRGGAE